MLLAVEICHRPRMLARRAREFFLEFLGDVDRMLVCVCMCACVCACACVISICGNHQLDLSLVVSIVVPTEIHER